MLRTVSLGLAALTAFLAASCVTGDYDRFRRYEPIEDAAWTALEPGESDLAACLAALGAPMRVWEPRPGALALAWVWVDRAGWGLSVSVPTGEAVDASFSYRDVSATDEGLLLVFDESWTLETLERGAVGDVLDTAPSARVVEG